MLQLTKCARRYTNSSHSTLSLEGKVAVVTGSTQGLGKAIAYLFKERGVSGLVLSGRNEDRGHAVMADLNSTSSTTSENGFETVFVQGDLAEVDVCRRIVATAKERFGRVDILVNAAAVTDRGTILDTTPEFWDWMMNVNLRAPFLLIQESIKLMKERQEEHHAQDSGASLGTIVNIGSVAAYGCVPNLMPYATSKGGLMTMTKNVAYSAMPDRIRINTLNIGWMDTPGEDAIQKRCENASEDWLEEAEAMQPFGRLLKPLEVAKAVAFLASEESGMMTGALVDFGQFVHGGGPMPTPSPHHK